MIVIVIGVCGSGKTTVGSCLADKLQWPFADADEFHSEENKTKMSAGLPLSDQDRLPWLQSIHNYVKRLSQDNQSGVVTCSALKKVYRDVLRYGDSQLLHFKGDSMSVTYKSGTTDGEQTCGQSAKSGTTDGEQTCGQSAKSGTTDGEQTCGQSAKSGTTDGEQTCGQSAKSGTTDGEQTCGQSAKSGTTDGEQTCGQSAGRTDDSQKKSSQNQGLDNQKQEHSEVDIQFIHLTGSKEVLEARVGNRLGHFMPAALLQSQLDILENLDEQEPGFMVDIDNTLDIIAKEIIYKLGI